MRTLLVAPLVLLLALSGCKTTSTSPSTPQPPASPSTTASSPAPPSAPSTPGATGSPAPSTDAPATREARINAILRRQPAVPALASAYIEDETYEFGDFRLEAGSRKLFRGDTEITLTHTEFSLLKVLAQHPRHPLSRERLMELARGKDYDSFDRAIDVQISRLRKLIEDNPGEPKRIQTVWGFGYVFVPDGAAR